MESTMYKDLIDFNPDYEDVDIVEVEYEPGVSRIQFFAHPVLVKDKDVIIVEGVCLYLDSETGEYEPDWDLTAVFDKVPEEEFDYNNFVYIEQDPPHVALHNFLNIVGGKG